MKLAALLICLSVAFTACDALYSKTRISVANVIVGAPITVHCFSGDNDLGYHKLAYLEPLSWSFRYNLISDTQYFCSITTQYGSGSYKVYGYDINVNRCGLNCVWQVRNTGPCLQLTQGGLWCLPWNKKKSA